MHQYFKSYVTSVTSEVVVHWGSKGVLHYLAYDLHLCKSGGQENLARVPAML